MYICLECFVQAEPDYYDEPFSPWHSAPKVYTQCETCERSTLCGELE